MTEPKTPVWRYYRTGYPPVGAKVFVCDVHWKQEFPGSWEIMGGEYVGFGRVETNDDSGKGSYGWDAGDGDEWQFWCYAEEMRPFLPKELP